MHRHHRLLQRQVDRKKHCHQYQQQPHAHHGLFQALHKNLDSHTFVVTVRSLVKGLHEPL